MWEQLGGIPSDRTSVNGLLLLVKDWMELADLVLWEGWGGLGILTVFVLPGHNVQNLEKHREHRVEFEETFSVLLMWLLYFGSIPEGWWSWRPPLEQHLVLKFRKDSCLLMLLYGSPSLFGKPPSHSRGSNSPFLTLGKIPKDCRTPPKGQVSKDIGELTGSQGDFSQEIASQRLWWQKKAETNGGGWPCPAREGDRNHRSPFLSSVTRLQVPKGLSHSSQTLCVWASRQQENRTDTLKIP